VSSHLVSFDQKRTKLTPGTVLVREWDRHSQRVMVMADGFAWNGQTYDSLSKVAFAITVPSGTVLASSDLRDVTAQVRATTIRKVCAQLIKNRQPKELPHSEMSRVERGLQVMDVVRHPRWNAQSSLNCPDTALSRPSRAMMRNTKPVSEASIQNVNPRYETGRGIGIRIG
jgi:Protein of unknown function (DUF2924)